MQLTGCTTVVTGAARGIGRAMALRFAREGSNLALIDLRLEDLAATASLVQDLGVEVRGYAANVADEQAVCGVMGKIVADFGRIDVLVNNAGIGLMGAFEVTPMTTVREIFETNTFGVMAVTQAVLPRMRERHSGVIVNVTSSATIAPFPLVAVYTASKTAIDGFTASLAHELAEFGVRVKLVQPGYGPNTSFVSNSGNRMDGLFPEPYAPFAQRIFAAAAQPGPTTTAGDVAEVVWRAANDASSQLRFPAGPDAVALAAG